MHTLATAILEHTTAAGVHHDWLIEDPTLADPHDPAARLWTARLLPPPARWASLRRIDLVVIPPHRRQYLTYQGSVSGNRGRVRRLAAGVVRPVLWTTGRIVLHAELSGFTGTIDAHQLGGAQWLAIVE